MSISFFLTALVVVLLPGTGVIYTLSVGLGRGFWASVAAAFGCTLGILPAALASVLGLATIFHSSALAFTLLKYAGATYLFYMAWSVLRSGGDLEMETNLQPKNTRKIAVQGFLLNVLNPKLSVFFLAFLPQFIDPSTANVTAQMLGLAFVFMLMTFFVFVLYGAFAAYARDYVISRPKVMLWLKRVFAGVFGLLGVKLVFSTQSS